jgi:SET domain-containing protein
LFLPCSFGSPVRNNCGFSRRQRVPSRSSWRKPSRSTRGRSSRKIHQGCGDEEKLCQCILPSQDLVPRNWSKVEKTVLVLTLTRL